VSIVADFFVASPENARAYATAETHDGLQLHLVPTRHKGITPLELGTLWAILEGCEWGVERHDIPDESPAEDGNSWLCRFPQPLVQLLADSSDGDLALARTHWAATEELGCAPEALEPVIADLQRLARQAIETGREMYLWGCT
jgi:hypothetical protein